MNEFYTLTTPSSSYTVAPLLSISHSTLFSIFNKIINNQPLFPREYVLLIIILSYVQLRTTNKINMERRLERFLFKILLSVYLFYIFC
jgi:hypothetical protein